MSVGRRGAGRDDKQSRFPRVALPVKLLLSYLLVLGVAAVPTFVYVRAELESDLVDDARSELSDVVRRSAPLFGSLDAQQRNARARDLAAMTGTRLSLISPAGVVWFDSTVPAADRLESHADRPEVIAALRGDTGTAERVSETTGKATLYAAQRMLDEKGNVVGVLRVAQLAHQVTSATESLTRFSRNVQAVAVSVAFLLSLVAAVQFMRPLQRVTAAARALAAGDLATKSGVVSDDEVGDAGRAIDSLAVEIRRRLANAGSGDAVLSQLIDALRVPCVVFEVSGDVLALNGAARRAYAIEGPNAARRVKELTSTDAFERALENAERDGEAEPISVDLGDSRSAPCLVHVLKRPGTAPLYVLLGQAERVDAATQLPAVDAVTPRLFVDVVRVAQERARAVMTSAGVELDVAEPPAVLVADTEQRVEHALVALFEGFARAAARQHTSLTVTTKVDDISVRLTIEAEPVAETLAAIKPLVEPLGGGIIGEQTSTTLWVPRA